MILIILYLCWLFQIHLSFGFFLHLGSVVLFLPSSLSLLLASIYFLFVFKVKSGAPCSSMLIFFNACSAFCKSKSALFKSRFVILLFILFSTLRILNFTVLWSLKPRLPLTFYIIQQFLFVSSRSNRISIIVCSSITCITHLSPVVQIYGLS